MFVAINSEVGSGEEGSVSGSHQHVGQRLYSSYTLHQQCACECLECDGRLQSVCLAQVSDHPSAVEQRTPLREAAVFSRGGWCKRRDPQFDLALQGTNYNEMTEPCDHLLMVTSPIL